MRRNSFSVPQSLCVAAALVAVAFAPFARGEQPFGLLGPLPQGNAASGVVALHGWALDDEGVESVDVMVDGVVVGRALTGGSRPDVALAFPGYPGAGESGVTFHLDTTRYLNGLHVVSALLVSISGERAFVDPVVLQVVNGVTMLQPFGQMDRPQPHAELFGACDLQATRRLTVVDGWVLDVGIQMGDTGVGYVELLLDGSILANSRRDCVFNPVTGGWTSCHGVRKLGLETLFPQVRDAPHGGFRFVIDVGELITARGWREGLHTLGIRAGDLANQATIVDTLPVTFRCADAGVDDLPIGEIDLPVGGNFFGGVVPITGFALDLDGVDLVQIFVDGVLQGTATYGIPRPEVAAIHPGFPDSATPGWLFLLDTRVLSDGPHELQVVVIDDNGVSGLIGERPFLVENAPLGAAGVRPVVTAVRTVPAGRP
jgi:N-acetylmuramoyl-L-alanine amidase